MDCSHISALENLAASLVKGAALELYLTPKPGLVDLADSGSHPDLSLATMERSIKLVADYLDEIVASLAQGEPFRRQQAIALRTEQRLMRELGTNTHRGYVFLSGMLLIARAQAAAPDERGLRTALSSLCQSFFEAGDQAATHGGWARRKYQAGGIVQESVLGFPAVFEAALPAYRASMRRDACAVRASFAMLARLMQVVDDTTALHRAGPAGLARVKMDGRRLEQILAEGGDYLTYLRELNRSYVRMNLTMGGVADMLGVSYGWLISTGEIPPPSSESNPEESDGLARVGRQSLQPLCRI